MTFIRNRNFEYKKLIMPQIQFQTIILAMAKKKNRNALDELPIV
jgi:hypothetical protein